MIMKTVLWDPKTFGFYLTTHQDHQKLLNISDITILYQVCLVQSGF